MFKPKPAYIVLFTTFLLKIIGVKGLTISFTPNNVTIHEDSTIAVEYVVTDVNDMEGNFFTFTLNLFAMHFVLISDVEEFLIYSDNEKIASLEREEIFLHPQINLMGEFNVSGNFLGTMFTFEYGLCVSQVLTFRKNDHKL